MIILLLLINANLVVIFCVEWNVGRGKGLKWRCGEQETQKYMKPTTTMDVTTKEVR